jgi:predicted Zn-dependent protease
MDAGVGTTVAENPFDITISFAPDGTNVGGYRNELFADLSQLAPPDDWQAIIVDAFQEWLQWIDADATVVRDQGAAFGTLGDVRGDSRFGDVRIAALPLLSDVIAVSLPRFAPAGTWAGDILFNSQSPLLTREELFAVALHEAGHVLGLRHSDDPSSPMFSHGIPASASPTMSDISQLRQLYSGAMGIDATTSVTHDEREYEVDDDAKSENEYFRSNDDELHAGQSNEQDGDERDLESSEPIDFEAEALRAVPWHPLFQATLGPENQQWSRDFKLSQPQLVQFVLSTKGEDEFKNAVVSATVKTSQGQVVRRLLAQADETVLDTLVLLLPGEYRFEVEGADGSRMREMKTLFYGQSFTLPIGPGISDPISSPMMPQDSPRKYSPYFKPRAGIIADPIVFPSSPYMSLPVSIAPAWWRRLRP